LLRPIPIIDLSGNARKEQIAVAKQAGMNDYLTKPFHKEDVYQSIYTHTQKVSFKKISYQLQR
jgi:CheY-like chemotaxis protein